MTFTLPGQPRSAGSDHGRQHIYGSDSTIVSTLEEVTEGLVAAARASSRSAARSVDSIRLHSSTTEPAVKERLQDALIELDAAVSCLDDASNHLESRDVSRPFRVVLMGRTMAGKSTLFEYLSGGDGSRVGVGAQRTTRHSCARTVRDLRIELVDTPGVGAMDGDDDYVTAFDEVSDADLILWVATDQATQEQTGRALRRLADLGKPIVVALNCLLDISDDLNRADLFEDPERVFGGDSLGNLGPIERHLASAGGTFVCAVQVHAQAALLSRSETLDPDEMRQLLESSRVVQLLDELHRQLERTAPQRQLVTAFDAVRTPHIELASSLDTQARDLRWFVTSYRGIRSSLRKRARRRVDDARDEITAATTAAVSERERWIEQVDPDLPVKEINRRWDDELLKLGSQLSSAFSEIGDRLAADLRTIELDVSDDWAHIKTDGFSGLGGRGEAWGNRAVKVGGRVAVGVGGLYAGAKLGAVVGSIIPGAGTTAGAVAGGAIGFAGGLLGVDRAIDWLGDQLFRSDSQIRERRRKKISKQLSPLLDQARKSIDQSAAAVVQAWTDSLHAADEKRSRTEKSLELCLEDLATADGVVESAISDLDLWLGRELLQLVGYTRIAAAVSRADRWRGAGLAVALPEPAFSELVLYPAKGCVERVLPTHEAASPPNLALQLLRSSSTAPIVVTSLSDEALTVQMNGSLTTGEREAWSALAQVHSGVLVTVHNEDSRGEDDAHDSHS